MDDTITKRPYVKHLTLFFFQFPTVAAPKTVRECLKNLTSEDFMQMAHQEWSSMNEFEKKFKNTQGQNTEHELAKIINRYQAEGKPDQYASGADSRKQVRFEEQSAFYQGEGQEISRGDENRV